MTTTRLGHHVRAPMTRASVRWPRGRAWLFALALLTSARALSVSAAEPLWYPPTEPSPFLPDDARWIGQPTNARGWARPIYLRATWTVKGPAERAVLMTAPMQAARVYLNGRLTLTAHDEREALPAWADVTDRLVSGDNFVAARVHSAWRPVFYAQMRVEYGDGSSEDFTTGEGWECATEPADDWWTNHGARGDWSPAEDTGGYSRDNGQSIWGHDFALLPREMLRERFEEHNRRLQDAWQADGDHSPLRLQDPPEEARWADQFQDFCRVDEDTGQLIDGSGRVRHLLFTIYNQQLDGQAVMSVPAMDFDQLERDLDLMAQADVHLYMRQTGWNWLLDATGDWATLEQQPTGNEVPRFELGIELLDYFVRRAHAHGRYIVFEGDFYWGAHRDVVPAPYRSRYHLYPEVLEAQALAMRKIMGRFRECPNVLGMMIGEEDILLAYDLENPHQHALFADYLRRKYGSIEAFRDQTPTGYDYGDLSSYRPATREPEYWPDSPAEEVLVPGHSPTTEPFADARSWLDIPLPHWPQFRSPAGPEVALAGFKSYNNYTPEDPLWIDFYEMREDELLFGMLCRWAAIVREAMPDQLLFYSNAQDFTNSWHFLHLFRRAELPFDVIGVGCHDSGKDLSELPSWATVRKAIKVISSYRPYALAPGSPPRGVASGEGEGGSAEHPMEVLNYYRGALFDEIGGGAAWTQTYTWLHMSGGNTGQPPHMTPLLQWLSAFMPAVQGVSFPLRRPVQVLIVRNANLQHSNMSGMDYGNARSVAEALTQLNVEFDIAMDRDLAYGENESRIDVSPYRLIILPSVWVDHPDAVWEVLDRWLGDPAHQGQRVLALGRIGGFGPHLQPRDAFPPVLQRWLERSQYAGQAALQGQQQVVLGEPQAGRRLDLDFGKIPPTGTFDTGAPFLRANDATIASRLPYRSNSIVAFGSPIGLAHEYLWGFEPQQEPRDAAAPLYEALLTLAGVDRPVLAPHNLRVYLSGDGKMLLVRERAGLATEAELAVRVPPDLEYDDVDVRRSDDGYTRFTASLDPWEGLYLGAQ